MIHRWKLEIANRDAFQKISTITMNTFQQENLMDAFNVELVKEIVQAVD